MSAISKKLLRYKRHYIISDFAIFNWSLVTQRRILAGTENSFRYIRHLVLSDIVISCFDCISAFACACGYVTSEVDCGILVGVGWLCCPDIVWEPIRKASSYVTHQGTLGHSYLGLLSFCGLTLAYQRVELVCVSYLHLNQKCRRGLIHRNLPPPPQSSYVEKKKTTTGSAGLTHTTVSVLRAVYVWLCNSCW